MSKTHSFVALYVGESIASARLISASANREIVCWVAEQMLQRSSSPTDDASVQAVQQGQNKALSLILEGK